MNSRSDKLRAIFGAPGWTRFIGNLRGHRDAGRTVPACVTLKNPTAEERIKLASLLRRPAPSRAQDLRYSSDDILHALAAAGIPATWEEILDLLCGPVPPSALAARATARSWLEFWPSARDLLEAAAFPLCNEWLDTLRSDGVFRRLSGGDAVAARQLLAQAAGLLRALPLAEDQPLAGVAARFCEDSHALDPDRPLSTLVLRGLALRQGIALPVRAPERRALWSQFGVVCDELSAPVLTFNLGVTGPATLAALVQQASLAAQPLHLTTRLLWTTPWQKLSFPPRAFVCENPTIIALAASRLGERCPPLICIDGEPKTAARLLLRALRNGGVTLHYHGDFDWAGVAIADRIIREFSAIPWKFDAEAYGDALRYRGRPLLGTPVPTPWASNLRDKMAESKRAYDEELLADTLLEDLLARL